MTPRGADGAGAVGHVDHAIGRVSAADVGQRAGQVDRAAGRGRRRARALLPPPTVWIEANWSVPLWTKICPEKLLLALPRMSVPLPSLAMPLLPPLTTPSKSLVPEPSRYSNWLLPRLRLPEAEIVRPPVPACHCCEARRTIALLKVWVWMSLFVSPASPSVSEPPLKVNPLVVEGVRLKASDVTACVAAERDGVL